MQQRTVSLQTVPTNGDRKRPQQSDPATNGNGEMKRTKIRIPDSVLSSTASYVTRPQQPPPQKSEQQQQTKPKSPPEQQPQKCTCTAVIDNTASLLEILAQYNSIPIGELNVKNVSRLLFENAFIDFTCAYCWEPRHYYPVKLLETSNQLNFIFQQLPTQHKEEILSGVKSPYYYQYKFNTFIDCNDFKYLMYDSHGRYIHSPIRSAITKVKSENGTTSCYIIKQNPETGKLIRYDEPIKATQQQSRPQQQQQQKQEPTSRGVLTIKQS